VTLDNAGAREIATALQGLAGQSGGEGARTPVSIAAIDSSNAIALRGDPTSVARFAEMAKQLDARAQSGAEIRVYRLEYANAETFWAPALLVLSLICDGIDGSLAIVTNKSTKWGAILDSTVDRLTEIFWVLALYKVGADLNLLIIVLLAAFVQEYMRARAGGLGVAEVGIVTFAERPVRASFVFIVFIALQLNFTIYNQIIMCWLVLQLISLFMLTRFTYSKLR
jgi:phosphatidylglycerophosphate synthase